MGTLKMPILRAINLILLPFYLGGSPLFAESNDKCPLFSLTKPVNGAYSVSGVRLYYNVVPSPGLSVFWAKELVGADLSADFVRALRANRVPFGLIDDGIQLSSLPYFQVDQSLSSEGEGPSRFNPANSKHGTPVANLIMQTSGAGASSSAVLNRFYSFYGDSSGALTEFSRPSALGFPRVINMSFKAENGWCSAFSELSKSDGSPLFVKGAGNDFFRLTDLCYSAIDRKAGIRIGSLSPYGVPSEFSQISGIDLFAPSDYFAQSIGNKGTSFEPFGGTSGAAPMVSGTALDIFSLLNSFSASDVRKIMVVSASPTGLKWLNLSSSKLLNSYRAVRLADRIRQFCDGKSAVECMPLAELNFNKFLDDFRQEARTYFAQGTEMFAQPECYKKFDGFGLLRKAFLLDPDNVRYSEKLAEIYENYRFEGAEFHGNSRYYRSISDPKYLDSGILKSYAPIGIASEEVISRRLQIRARVAALDDASEGPIMKALQSTDPYLVTAALELSTYWFKFRHSERLYELIKSKDFSRSNVDRFLRLTALYSSNRERSKLIDEALTDSDEKIKELGHQWTSQR